MSERGRAIAELGALGVTAGLFLIFENALDLKLHFLIPAILAWTAYLAVRVARDRSLIREWGIRLDNLGKAAPSCAAVFLIGIAALVALRAALGWKPFPAWAWWLFLAYPAWAFVQQFVLQALVAGNLERLGLGRPAVVLVASALFGLVHLPDAELGALCAGAGVAWTILYLRWRNLPVLVLSHAWLGTLAYAWILERPSVIG